jgi:hypothetical protein
MDHIDFSNKNITLDEILNEALNDKSYDLSDEDVESYDLSNYKPLSDYLTKITELGNTFSKLDISYNNLYSKGLDQLLDVLLNNNNLRFLSIAYNKATSKGIYNFLIKILTFSQMIPYVDIRGNYGSDLTCIKKVLETIKDDTKLTEEFKNKIIWYGTEPFKWQ